MATSPSNKFSLKRFLDGINMYRLALYYLASLILASAILSAVNLLPYKPHHILLSALFLVIVSALCNFFFSKIIGTKPSNDSAFITALILALIVGPELNTENLILLAFVAVASQLSKYLLVWRGKHIFNPAAVAVLGAALLLEQGASWWVGNIYLAPIVVAFGLLLADKIGRLKMILSFLATYLLLIIVLNENLSLLWQLITYSPILFFAFVMLPEPQTSPKRNEGKLVYGIAAALMLILLQEFLTVGYTLELALVLANLGTFIAYRGFRMSLILKEKTEITPTIYELKFEPERPIKFLPGQFLEWTLYHHHADSRGIRRYFTIASSPTERNILLTTRYPEKPSSFKKSLLDLRPEEKIIATGTEGDFVLPKDRSIKLAFLAGGIGITPFRSMMKYLIDTSEKRDVVLLYYASSPKDFVYKEVFEEAEKKIGAKVVYIVSDKNHAPADWRGETGFPDESSLKRLIPDWQERVFYISGPLGMIGGLKQILSDIGIKKSKVKTDYFPGYEEI